MKGFVKILAINFDAWNDNALINYYTKTQDETALKYSYFIPDSNQNYVWVRVEHDFIESNVKSLEEATIDGMIIPIAED